MKLEIHIHTHAHPDDSVIQKLNVITQKLNNMPTKAEFQAQIDRISSGIANIADDIRRLVEQAQNAGLTAEEETDIFAQLTAKADALDALAAQTPEPDAPETPVEPA